MAPSSASVISRAPAMQNGTHDLTHMSVIVDDQDRRREKSMRTMVPQMTAHPASNL
jgi:hypothetical protein